MGSVAVVKIIGVGSLGLLSGSLIYQSFESIPQWIKQINSYEYNDKFISELIRIKRSINTTRIFNLVLGGLSSCFFGISYMTSTVNEKHPYLLYLSLIGPITLVTLFYNNYNNFTSLSTKLHQEKLQLQHDHLQQHGKLDSSQDGKLDSSQDDLGKSYIHVSEDESSTSTPSSSTPNSPTLSEKGYDQDIKIDQEIDQEIDQTLIKREFVNDLDNMESSYNIGSIISGLGFLLSLVGIVGDFYL